MFPIITKEIQKKFEKEKKTKDGIPEICGKYGRACRCMDSKEGTNKNPCMTCPLSNFAEKRTYREI